MSNSMKSSNEYPLYEAQGPKPKEDPKWNKRGINPKGKEMTYLRGEDKGSDYAEQQQFQKHPNKKNYSSYSSKNQGDDYDKGNQSIKGNNQSPTYKKNAKGKKDGYGDYPGNSTLDDGINEKEDFLNYKKNNIQQFYGNKETGGYNQKVKVRYNGQNGQQGLLNQNTSSHWDKNQNPLGNYHQLGQLGQTGKPQMGYYDKGNFMYQNSFQLQQFNQQGQQQPQSQSQGQGQYGYRGQYQGEHKPNMSSIPGKSVNGINPNAFNMNSNQVNQSNIQYFNTEGSFYNNVPFQINQEKEVSSEGDDNYLPQQQGQYLLKQGGVGYIPDHIEGNSYIQSAKEQILPHQINQVNFPMMNPNAHRNYQQDLFFQQQMAGQSNSYLVDQQMLKGMSRVPNMGVMNMPQQIDQQHTQMYQMPQGPYGMNHNNGSGGGMVKTKKKSSMKIGQYQDGSSSNVNNKHSMKMHYNNNNGKYYKGSHSTQGIKNTMPNFNGGNLSLMNMVNNNSNTNIPTNAPMGMNSPLPTQKQMLNPSYSTVPSSVKPYAKPKRNVNNPYRSVISDKTVGTSGSNVSVGKPKQNDYYNPNKHQQQQYFKYNPQTQKYHLKSEELSNQETDYDASIMSSAQESIDLYSKPQNSAINSSNNNQNEVSLYIKVKLEDGRETVVELKNSKDLSSVVEALKSYNLKENQVTFIFYKIVEAQNISAKILNVPLGRYDQKQLIILNKETAQKSTSMRQSQKHHNYFPNIQIDDIDDSFSFESNTYESIANEIRPDYTDIKEYELLNTTQ